LTPGDAFRQAHGGNSIGDFLKAMVSSLRVLKAAPKPASYDGLLHLANAPSADDSKKVVDGWRVVETDGAGALPAECFVAANRFCVRPGYEAAFEARWAQRESNLRELPGLKSFTMLLKDPGAEPPHGAAETDECNYMSFTIWADREAFAGWRSSQSFKDAHSAGPPRAASELAPWTKPPTLAFWDGVLEITAPQGA